MTLEVAKYVGYHVLAMAVGIAMFVIALRIFHRNFEAHESLEVKGVKITGSAVVLVIGLAFMFAPFFPRFDGPKPAPTPSSSASPTEHPDLDPTASPSSSQSPPAPREATTYVTHRGVVCATYVDAEMMGCVVTDHPGWGFAGCQYLFKLSAFGEAKYESCPSPQTLARLYLYPAKDVTAVNNDDAPTLAVGVARCEFNPDFTECKNLDGGHFKVSREHSTPKIKKITR